MLRSAAGPASWQNDLTAITASDWNYDFAAHLLERRGAERLIDVAARIENVFEQSVDPPSADAVELRADFGALVGDLVAGGAVLLKDRRAGSGVPFAGIERGFAGAEQFL